MITTFTLNIVLSTYHGRPGDLSYPGLLNLGKFDTIPYHIYEIPLFMIMGTIGGLLGSCWNYLNYIITCFRLKYIKRKWLKVVEAISIGILSATMGFTMIYFLNDCQPLGQDPTKYPIRMYCNEGEYNTVAALWFQTPESSVRSLFHDPKGNTPATHENEPAFNKSFVRRFSPRHDFSYFRCDLLFPGCLHFWPLYVQWTFHPVPLNWVCLGQANRIVPLETIPELRKKRT